jgi:diguanylate cyclase (GGDEF)-like protein
MNAQLKEELDVNKRSFKKQRAKQIIWATQVICFLLLLIHFNSANESYVEVILIVGLLINFLALSQHQRNNIELAIFILLWNLSLIATLLVWFNHGLFDTALFAYPGILIYAALLANRRLFIVIMGFLMLSVLSLGLVNLLGWYVSTPTSFLVNQVIDIGAIMLLIGFSTRLLSADLIKVSQQLLRENNAVKKSQAEIAHLAHHDFLTGLPNRILSRDRFEHAIAHLGREQSHVAVLFVDLDHFKPVNDLFGHDVGDLLLKEVASRIHHTIREQDTICRFGGDEFLIILESFDNQLFVSEIAKKLLTRLCQPFYLINHKVEISASIGIAMAPTDSCDFEDICKKADMAMYTAKDQGRNNFSFYDDKLNQQVLSKNVLVNELRNAIVDKTLMVYFQPKINLRTNQVIGAEALLRWQKKDGSIVPPAVFIPLAEEHGMILEIGRRVLKEACQQCYYWHQQGFAALSVSVNLSIHQFKKGNLKQDILTALADSKLSAQFLELEITEPLLMQGDEKTMKQIHQLKLLGVKFIVDEFGLGSSNLRDLHNCQLAQLKIDRSFIERFMNNEQDKVIVKTVINMAKELNIITVCIGVNDSYTKDCLILLGCQYGQGFYWSKALPSEDFLHYMLQPHG